MRSRSFATRSCPGERWRAAFSSRLPLKIIYEGGENAGVSWVPSRFIQQVKTWGG